MHAVKRAASLPLDDESSRWPKPRRTDNDIFELGRTGPAHATKLDLPGVGTVVKIFTTSVRRNYLTPWQTKKSTNWTGSGFAISDRRIVTNAHAVQDAAMLQVTKQDLPKKFRAHVACIPNLPVPYMPHGHRIHGACRLHLPAIAWVHDCRGALHAAYTHT